MLMFQWSCVSASDERQGECSTSGREADTWIIPMVQLGSAGLRQVLSLSHPTSWTCCSCCPGKKQLIALPLVHKPALSSNIHAWRCCEQDEALTTLFLRATEPGSSLAVSTAYLNLARSYEAALAAKPQVIASAPTFCTAFQVAGPCPKKRLWEALHLPGKYCMCEAHSAMQSASASADLAWQHWHE